MTSSSGSGERTSAHQDLMRGGVRDGTADGRRRFHGGRDLTEALRARAIAGQERSWYRLSMAILPRETSGRRYLLGSGLWFGFWGLFVLGSAAIFDAPDVVVRVMWLLLGALLTGRGVQQLLRARKAPKDPPARKAGVGYDAQDPRAPSGSPSRETSETSEMSSPSETRSA
jgi:hypothetical protein